MNVLIIADYRTPKSGNFAAYIFDLGISIRKYGGSKAVYMFPENNRGGQWTENQDI